MAGSITWFSAAAPTATCSRRCTVFANALPHGEELPYGGRGMIRSRSVPAARLWKGSALHKQRRQAGSLQPHRNSAVRGAPRAAGLGSRYASGGRSSDEDEDEERRQQRQWRQRTLRSLRQDLSHQQRRQQGHASGTQWHTGQDGRSSQSRPSEPKAGSGPAWQHEGGARHGAARASPASQAPSQHASTSSNSDSSMHPDGYFLDILKGGPDPAPQAHATAHPWCPAESRCDACMALTHVRTRLISPPVQRKALWVQTGVPRSRACPRAWASALI